eukprot:scaffold648022_cov46-Prasinocladus_malaysianus.AAC.1
MDRGDRSSTARAEAPQLQPVRYEYYTPYGAGGAFLLSLGPRFFPRQAKEDLGDIGHHGMAAALSRVFVP